MFWALKEAQNYSWTAAMKCPECKTGDAYIGFNQIECNNSKCKYYVPVRIWEKEKDTKPTEPDPKSDDQQDDEPS